MRLFAPVLKARFWPTQNPEEPLFLRIGNLTRSGIGIDFSNTVRLQLPETVLGEAARTRVQPNDILLSITAYIGSVAVVPSGIEEAYVSQHIACCRPRLDAALPLWISYVLLSSIGQTHGKLSMYGGTKQGLSLDDVRNYVILVPPIDEQSHLVSYIEKATSDVDAAIGHAKHEINLLREYRTRLTTDVVTGQFDVRAVAAGLPNESVDLEPPDYDDDLSYDDAAEGEESLNRDYD